MNGRIRLCDVAVIVDPAADNVAVVKAPLRNGLRVVHGNGGMEVRDDLSMGDRMAIAEIPSGDYLIQFGLPFAKSTGIRKGEKVSSANTIDALPKGRPARNRSRLTVTRRDACKQRRFMGYERSDGRCGTRNIFVVVPTSMCASATAVHIAGAFEDGKSRRGVDGVVALANTEGCGCAGGLQIERFLRVLKNTILHPNVGGALIVDLGCEQTNRAVMHDYLCRGVTAGRLGKPIDWLTIQRAGGARRAQEKGIRLVGARLGRLGEAARKPCPIGKLVVGAECGASDAFSGITANRVIGNAVDKVISGKGAAIFSELPEMVGAERILFPRMRDRAVLEKFKAGMRWYDRIARRLNAPMDNNLVPENKAGGLLNPFIKSIGAVMKGGTAIIEDFLDYGEAVGKKGLSIMQGPGNDLESVTGLAASGATVICFSTGRGTVTGNAIVPVIKISSTSALYRRMPEDIDFDAGAVIGPERRRPTFDQAGDALLAKILSVASGEKTGSETARQRQFQVWTAGKLSL
ncbi:MAG: UxaA family hydrolase [Deltaproteobacteria bacterium]|nr:UxaA family hydrolase [Deltaproteobacteria bacterium]